MRVCPTGAAACLVRGDRAFDVGRPQEGLKLVNNDRSVCCWQGQSSARAWLFQGSCKNTPFQQGLRKALPSDYGFTRACKLPGRCLSRTFLVTF